MQIQKLFTVYDEKAEVFLPPFFVPTKGIAIRAFTDCVNSKDHQFGKHPHDYTLFYLGEWFDTDASFSIMDKKSVGNGVEFINLETGDDDETDSPIQPDQNGGHSA